MKIKTVIRTEEGSYDASADFTEDQVRFLLEYALADIIARGVTHKEMEEAMGDIQFVLPDAKVN